MLGISRLVMSYPDNSPIGNWNIFTTKKFTFNELEYLWANGYIYEDRNTFIVMVTDGFGQ